MATAIGLTMTDKRGVALADGGFTKAMQGFVV